MTDWEFLAMQNSTSVRSPEPPLTARLLRPGVATLSALAPALAARVAERLFLTAPRYPAPAHAPPVLAGARHRRALDRHGGRRAGVARRPPRRRRRLHRAAGGPDLTVAHASRGARLWTAGA